VKRPLQNTLAATAADGTSRLLGFIATAYLARVLGTSEFGVVSVGFAVLGYAALVSSPGLHTLGTRDVAGSSDSRTVLANDLNSLRLVLAGGSVLLTALIGVVAFGTDSSWLMIALFATSALPLAWSLDWYFQGKGRIVATSVAKVLGYALYVLLVLLVVRSPSDAIWTPVAFLAANALSAALLFGMFQRDVGGGKWSWNPPAWKLLMRESVPLGVSSVLTQTIVNLPVLIAGALLSMHETGLFSASMKLLFFALMIDRVYNLLFFPAISRYRQLEGRLFDQLAAVGLKSMATMALPVAVLGVAFAPTLLAIVYGPVYAAGASTLRWLFPYFIFTTINTVAMAVLYADRRDKEVVWALTIGTVALILLCVGLSLLWHEEGTALGLSAGEGVITVLLLLRIRGAVSFHPLRILLPIMISGSAMGALLLVMHEMPPLLGAAAAMASYGLCIYALGGLGKEDIRFLKQRFV
jgi:O-antigen/teichoic acid export membrane protein